MRYSTFTPAHYTPLFLLRNADKRMNKVCEFCEKWVQQVVYITANKTFAPDVFIHRTKLEKTKIY